MNRFFLLFAVAGVLACGGNETKEAPPVHSPTTSLARDSKDIPGYVELALGYVIPKDCFHIVPPGGTVDASLQSCSGMGYVRQPDHSLISAKDLLTARQTSASSLHTGTPTSDLWTGSSWATMLTNPLQHTYSSICACSPVVGEIVSGGGPLLDHTEEFSTLTPKKSPDSYTDYGDTGYVTQGYLIPGGGGGVFGLQFTEFSGNLPSFPQAYISFGDPQTNGDWTLGFGAIVEGTNGAGGVIGFEALSVFDYDATCARTVIIGGKRFVTNGRCFHVYAATVTISSTGATSVSVSSAYTVSSYPNDAPAASFTIQMSSATNWAISVTDSNMSHTATMNVTQPTGASIVAQGTDLFSDYGQLYAATPQPPCTWMAEPGSGTHVQFTNLHLYTWYSSTDNWASRNDETEDVLYPFNGNFTVSSWGSSNPTTYFPSCGAGFGQQNPSGSSHIQDWYY